MLETLIAADGLYALVSLDGGPLNADEAAGFGITIVPGQSRCAAAVRDRGAPTDATGNPLLLGHLDAPAALAARLGMAADTPPALLVGAALARYGDDAPVQLPGEWSYLDWDAGAATLTLAVSATPRDPLLFATDGRRVAVAPHVRAFCALGWIDSQPGGTGLMMAMGRASVRSVMAGETVLPGVRSVGAGTVVRIATGGVKTSRRSVLPTPEPWSGSFADAVVTLDELLHKIVREQLDRHPATAVMLSGGLDSSLLAMAAADGRRDGDVVIAVSSAAPPGSGIADEMPFARAVAEQLGVPIVAVAPAADAHAFRPTVEMLRWLQSPLPSQRHYLYDALYRAAVTAGADGILDGSHGEWTLTGYPDGFGWRARWRERVKRVLRPTPPRQTVDGFHVRLAAPALALAERELRPALDARDMVLPVHRAHEPWGYSPMIDKDPDEPTSTHWPGLRRMVPLRDRRLLTLFAGMPYRFITHGGVTRAPARALLAGRVPDAVRLRPRGMAFSPDYWERLRHDAPAARAWLPNYRRAGAGEWLDLDWLDTALTQVAAGTASADVAITAQMTACAAAWLADWPAS